MNFVLLLLAVVFLLCICVHNISEKLGLPALLLFMFLGMLFGSDGLFKINFDDYALTQNVSSIALIFIMFFGGFSTKWSAAKPVAVKAVILSTAGVILTAALTGGFCYLVFGFPLLQSLLIGAVLGSTDAASVFAILRSKNLNLRDGTASLLEVESGSNDPTAYMLTTILLSLLGQDGGIGVGKLIFSQIFFGVIIGVTIAFLAAFLMKKLTIISSEFYTIFVIAIVLLSYAVTEYLHGNGFLSVYLTGIILGNQKIPEKKNLVLFFDSVTQLSQMILFFILGLLAFPHKFLSVMGPALLIAVFMTIIARPAVIFALLKPFKTSWQQCTLVAWSGLRGAASIAFAVVVVSSGIELEIDIFHVVFFIALFSVALQGSLLPFLSRKLHMIDDNVDVHKTFNDYQEESSMTLMRFVIPKEHHWVGHTLSEAHFPVGSLVLMIKRGEETLVPGGDTSILPGDSLIMSVPGYDSGQDEIHLKEIDISKSHIWCSKYIEELTLPDQHLIVLIKRGDENIVPSGKTKIEAGDVAVICS